MQMTIIVLVISMVLFFVLFFGIGFLLNMVLRMSWIMAIIYPIVALLLVNEAKLSAYFSNSKETFIGLGTKVTDLAAADIMILSSGLAGAITAGLTIRLLRRKGYRMF